MSKKDTWFKFNPSQWLLGRIVDEPAAIQVAFTTISCMYWVKKGKLLRKNVKKVSSKRIQNLIEGKYIIENGEFIEVPFLKDQLEYNEVYRSTQSEFGKLGGRGNKKGSLSIEKGTQSPRALENKNKNKNENSRIENRE